MKPISCMIISSEERIAIIEVGGTVGDIESQPFLEAIRQFRHEIGIIAVRAFALLA